VGHDGEGERGDVGVEQAVEAAADTVVVERRQLPRGQSEEFGDMACQGYRILRSTLE
jgi:hypothetical protein